MAADAEAVSAIPPGVLVTWAQRNDQVMVGVELPGCTSAECDFADSGVVQLRARSGVDGAETRLTLALRGAIVAADYPRVAGRGVQLVLPSSSSASGTGCSRASARDVRRLGSVDGRRRGGGARRARRAAAAARNLAPPRRPKLSARARRAADSRQPDRHDAFDERSDGCAAGRAEPIRCAERSAPPPQPRAGKVGAATCSPVWTRDPSTRARHVTRRRRGRGDHPVLARASARIIDYAHLQ